MKKWQSYPGSKHKGLCLYKGFNTPLPITAAALPAQGQRLSAGKQPLKETCIWSMVGY